MEVREKLGARRGTCWLPGVVSKPILAFLNSRLGQVRMNTTQLVAYHWEERGQEKMACARTIAATQSQLHWGVVHGRTPTQGHELRAELHRLDGMDGWSG